ncbi:MAG: response regulator [Pseudomonadota bacterium]
MKRILIVDDHAVVREGLKRFLDETPDLRIAGEAGSMGEALAMVRDQEWDLVLLDIVLPDQNGLEGVKRIKRVKPDLPVLVFSNFTENEFALTSLEAGAAGFVGKDSSPEQLRTAIRTAISGRRYVGPVLAERLLTGVAPQQPRRLPHEQLSAREMEILLRISKGQSLTDIGKQLHLSVKTISTYRSRILQKMGMETNAELTRYVVLHKLDQ